MCYCGTDLTFEHCCQPYIVGQRTPAHAEQLMRSRFSAYVIRNADYIHHTYAVEKRPENVIADIYDFAKSCRFIKLKVLNSEENGDLATVEFSAQYFYQNLFCQLNELSRFEKRDDQWFYVDGDITPAPDLKVGRNDLCPCGSDKKYKKCHATG